ncbi:PREDICTED: cell surface glycoprotein CD200 receptor 1-A-like isoform X2 [Gavialis gangeticus]|uniref:cell surface glycoprotein CD200 receptor 1-A-like isoform X2 n=1 Tax=Gavialis gangeticus TaxID=94835 RepID=UPI00092FC077|nr:PREDICTED: cell surface glycoprotein CD200 receptor 1-A-like isoform X2 [Gavialis gangeticus]
MHLVGKWRCAFLLLTIVVSMVMLGSQAGNTTEPKTQPKEENNSDPQEKCKACRTQSIANENISGSAGSRVLLPCASPSWDSLVAVTWNIQPWSGAHCSLAYRNDTHMVTRTNCSERLDWKSEPEQNFTLQFPSVQLTDEGFYICEIVTSDGNFHQCYCLTVLVPPKVTMNCNASGNVVCKAAAGKPAAQISWVPEVCDSATDESHPNGTVTVLSTCIANTTADSQVTCFVSHPTGSQNQSIGCPSEKGNEWVICVATLAGLMVGILFLLAFTYCYKLYHGRICQKTKTPETVPTENVQDNHELELEPYTIFVQKENVIYNSVSDLTMRDNVPVGL